MNDLRTCHGGRAYRAAFGHRMRGSGPVADMIARRFSVARRKLGLDRKLPDLVTHRFRAPPTAQGDLFG